jgi:hypothetical protein
MSMTGKTDPQVEVYRKLAAWQRIAAASQLYSFAKEIVKERIKRSNPNISEAELEKKIRVYF